MCQKQKRPKSKSGKISSNSTKSRPKPSQQRLPEEKEPQRQHRQPGGGAPEPTEPRGHSIPVSIDRQPRGYPRHPGALTCHLDTLKGVTRGQQSAQTQEVTRGSIQIRFLAVIQPRRPAGEKGAYFVTPARPVSPTTSRRPSAPAVEATPHQVLIHGVHPRIQAGGHDPRLSGKYKLLTY